MITISKTRFIPYDWINKQWTEVEDVHPFALLRETVSTIEEDVTVGDLISIVAQDDILCMFFDAYSGCDLGAMHRELQKPAPESPDNEIDGFAHVYIIAELTENSKGQRELRHYTSFGGMDFSKMKIPEENAPSNPEGQCSLSLTPLHELARIPIKLADAGFLTLWKSRGEKMRQQEFEARFDKVGSQFDLITFLDTIFNDISFWGDDEGKSLLKDKIIGMTKSIEDGTAVLHPFEAFPEEEVA